VDVAFPPRFTKLLVEFEGGMRLAFADPRRLGRIYLRSDPLHTSPIKDLAPDALLAPPSAAAFAAALQPLACAVKALLLDQNRVVSGVGNWIADEVCYQSRVHPERPADRWTTLSLPRCTRRFSTWFKRPWPAAQDLISSRRATSSTTGGPRARKAS
jgi:formamidopyrimidine-DNA glycosylase